MNEVEEFEQWKSGFNLRDDGYAAFRALKQIEKVRFILAVNEGGLREELEEAIT